MGIVHRGIPKQLATQLAQKHNCRVFFETGTLVGNTARWAYDSKLFDEIYTVEAVAEYRQRAATQLASTTVRQISGKSQEVLAAWAFRIRGNCLFWLDAHWSPDLVGKKPDVICPVLNELAAVNLRQRNDVVLVDDARLFGSVGGWPALDVVIRAVEQNGRRRVYVRDDVVVGEPR